MKAVLRVTSLLCGIAAVLSLVSNISLFFGRELGLMRMSFFSLITESGVLGVIGKIIGMLVMVAGLGLMCFFGFKATGKNGAKYGNIAMIVGISMSCVMIISLIVNMLGSFFGMSDIIMLGLTLTYCVSVFLSVDV